jgi:hypothetical protein
LGISEEKSKNSEKISRIDFILNKLIFTTKTGKIALSIVCFD